MNTLMKDRRKQSFDLNKFELKHYRVLGNLLKECGRLKLSLKTMMQIDIDGFGDNIVITFLDVNKEYRLEGSIMKHDYGKTYVVYNGQGIEEKEESYSFKSERGIINWCNKLNTE